MALAAGRVGVSPQDVDNRGHITTGGMTPEQEAKLNRALVSPVTAPLENELVGVGTGNDQIMVKVGEGLTLEGATSPFTLKSSGGNKTYSAFERGTKMDPGYDYTMAHDAVVMWWTNDPSGVGIRVTVGGDTNSISIPIGNVPGVAFVKEGDVIAVPPVPSGSTVQAVYCYLTRI